MSGTIGGVVCLHLILTQLTALIVFFCAGMYAAAGIGGGGFYASVFIAVMRFSPHQAVPLAYLTVFGVSVGSFGFLVRSRHPFANRPVIDFLLCLVLEVRLIGVPCRFLFIC